MSAPIYDDTGAPLNYIIVIDAGSKGTRAYIYAYTDNEPQIIISHKDWHKRIKPSIEQIVTTNGYQQSLINTYLDHLLYQINNIIPIEQHYRTPIFFHSTAGFRILEPTIQSSIQDHICTYFTNTLDYYVPNCATHIQTIDGQIEGLYSWITLNYLKNTLNETQGLLQLGGGSAQIVYESPDPIKAFHGISLTLNLQTYNLYSNSYLGFGLVQFSKEFQSSLTTIDSCLPTGYTLETLIDNKKRILHGSGDFTSCMQSIYKHISLKYDACSTLTDFQQSNCLIAPEQFDINSHKFTAISGYNTVFKQLRNLFDIHDGIKDFTESTRHLCSMSLEELKLLPNTDKLSTDELAELCFKATYINALLNSGFNTSVNSENLTFQGKFNDAKFSWTLGRAYLYALSESDQKSGYFNNISPHIFIHGSEENTQQKRPQFQLSQNYPSQKPSPPNYDPNLTDISNTINSTPNVKSVSTTLVILTLIIFIFGTSVAVSSRLRRLLLTIRGKITPQRWNSWEFQHKVNDSNLDFEINQPNNDNNDINLTTFDHRWSVSDDVSLDWDNDSDGIERAI